MSSKPISLLGHMHVCPLVNPGPVPHVGGPVVDPGQSFVRVTGLPMAVVGGTTMCTPVGASDPMAMGSTIVRISGKPVMRIGDPTGHGGKMVMGVPFVRSS